MKVNCYLATKPEVEGFRDQCFEVESLRVKRLWLLKKVKGGARHQFINHEWQGVLLY